MVSMAQIYKALDAQNAHIFVYDIGFAPAATVEVNDQYAVFFDPKLVRSTAMLKECLAHECGHCATGATHHLVSEWDLVSRHEYKANRWAMEQFLPFEDLRTAVQAGLTEPWQLAEYFDVPERFVRKALYHYTEIRCLHFWEPAQERTDPA